MLRAVTADGILGGIASPFDAETQSGAGAIVDDVRARGEPAVRDHAERFGELNPGDDLVVGPEGLRSALGEIDAATRALLERTAERIRVFAEAQRATLSDLDTAVPGGRGGHTVVPMDVAGCYAPGGRYPLPSSVLMTAVPARAAGVGVVIVATPSSDPVMKAAAAIAGADMMLCVGGAQAVSALAFGVGVPACDVIVGPGNRWVTAAKHRVSSVCAIDMLAGPSELLIIADETADPAVVAADLLAQAEHDPDALACLVTTDPTLPDRVGDELGRQLASLPTADVARRSLANGWSCVVTGMDDAVGVSDRVAPEHLEILADDAREVARKIRHAGGVFIGSRSAEVMGDYGVGPNHTLPTGRTARARGGLSVLDFLRVRTWLDLEDASAVLDDTVMLARIEGLEAHARSAERRR